MGYHDEQDDLVDETLIETTPAELVRWIEDQYVGDDRFETIEVRIDGLHEGEAARVEFLCGTGIRFFVAVRDEDCRVRVGLTCDDEELSEKIEETAQETAGSLTEFLALATESDLELDYEMRHFQDEAFYFCSDIPYQRDADLGSEYFHDEIIYYLEAYLSCLYEFSEHGAE